MVSISPTLYLIDSGIICKNNKESSTLNLLNVKEKTQMDFNTFLIRFGFHPDDFVNRYNEPIQTDDGFIYEVEQLIRDIDRVCPHCDFSNCTKHDNDTIEISCNETDHIKDTLRIKRHRLLCKRCNKTYTPDIAGISRYSKTSNQTIDMIRKDFFKLLSFSAIAQRYGLTTARIIQIFDSLVNYVPRRSLPNVLCIDEKRFSEEFNQKYCCILYDFDTGEISDVIKNRQLPYLEEYFSSIKDQERNRVKVFISDMNDSYKTIRKKFFNKSLHVVDLFHVVKLLTEAVKKIRINAMNEYEKGTLEYNFMKRHWKLFQCRKEDIPNKLYYHKKTKMEYPLADLVFRCVLKNKALNEAYNILQDLYHYNYQLFSYNEAFEFVLYIANRLSLSGDTLLESVGKSYTKWAAEIANGLAYNQSSRRFSNSIAECLNNHIETIIRISYGYHNFERFRKRVMLIRTYKKDLK